MAEFSQEVQAARNEGLASPEHRAMELQALIGQQEADMKWGHRVERDRHRTGPVISFDYLPESVHVAENAGWTPDWWVPVIHAVVDYRRWLDDYAECL